MKPVLDELFYKGLIRRLVTHSNAVYFVPLAPVAGSEDDMSVAQYRREIRPFRELKGYGEFLRNAMVRR